MPHTQAINTTIYRGARNAIATCLRVQTGEQVVLIYDRSTIRIARALERAILAQKATPQLFLLEDFVDRPMSAMPHPILQALQESQVSIFAARAWPGELPARMQLMHIINQRRIRHGHMVNISERIMQQGMQADFHLIDKLSQHLLCLLQTARNIRVTSPAGTDLRVHLAPHLRWVKTSGIISPQKWGNLPGGEIFTSPYRVDGKFVVDGVIGDYLCAKYGILENTPLVMTIENSRVHKVTCNNLALQKDFLTYIQADPNGNRVGEFAIGTNLAVTRLIGEILQDEKIPGVHIAFGHPYSEHTGQYWSSRIHIDCVIQQATIQVDDQVIMQEGTFQFHRFNFHPAPIIHQ